MDDLPESKKKHSVSETYQIPCVPDFLKESNEDHSDIFESYSDILTIRKEATLNYDGRQFFVRIPSEISKFYSLKKGDKVELSIENDDTSKKRREIILSLKVIEDATI
jgi:cold shock CspA family protein